MPRSWLARVALGVMLGAVAIYTAQQLFPTDERRIRRQLDAIADEANSLTPDLSGAATAAKLSTYFTEDVTIDPGGGIDPLRGRETIIALARTVQQRGTTRVSISDVKIVVTPERTSAAVTLVVTITHDVEPNQETMDTRELALTMVKRDKVWLISRVTAVEILR